MISIINNIGGEDNHPPIVTNLHTIGEQKLDSITIQYHVEDEEMQICRHYITVSGLYERREITRAVGYDKNDFTYKIENLKKDTTYSIQITCTDGLLEGKSNAIQAKTKSVITHGIIIDENNSNPETSVTYTDEAIGMTPAKGSNWGSWKSIWPFNAIKPCGFRNGKFVGYLQEFNYTKFIDGSNVSDDIDIMIEFPKIWWKFTRFGNKLKVQIADSPLVEFTCPAFTVGYQEFNKLYISAYHAVEENEKLRSKRNVDFKYTPYKISENRAFANRNGYKLMGYYQHLMICILYLLAFKNLNSQMVFGVGQDHHVTKNSGSAETEGMLYGTQNSQEPIKLFGLEDYYGPCSTALDGAFIDSTTLYISRQDVYNSTGAGYENMGDIIPFDGYGYISKVQGTSKLGFLPTSYEGSESTYYCDYIYLEDARFRCLNYLTLRSYESGNPKNGIFCLQNIDADGAENGIPANCPVRLLCFR